MLKSAFVVENPTAKFVKKDDKMSTTFFQLIFILTYFSDILKVNFNFLSHQNKKLKKNHLMMKNYLH